MNKNLFGGRRIMRLAVFVLAAVLATSGMKSDGVYAENKIKLNPDSSVAEAYLGESLLQKGFSCIEPGTDKAFNVASRGGESCWLMDKLQGTAKAYIYFDLAKEFKGEVFDGSEYDVEIDYFDSGKGFFRIYYDSKEYGKNEVMTIYTNNEKTWKTARFTLYDAAFGGGADGHDIMLSIKEKSSATATSISGESMAIKRISVRRRAGANPIYASAATDAVGNTYRWFDENKIMHNRLQNTTDESLSAQVTHRLVSDEYVKAFEETKEITIAPNEILEYDTDFGSVERCDMYRYRTEIKIPSKNVVSEFDLFDTAIIKTDPEGRPNNDVYVTAHLERYDQSRVPGAVEMLKMGNLPGIRCNISWKDMEKTMGALDFQNHPVYEVYRQLMENGLKIMPIFSGMSTAYLSGAYNTEIPANEKQYAGWENYIRYTVSQIKDSVDIYEIWNEPNVKTFNPLMQTGDKYAKAANIAAKEIKAQDPDARVAVMALTWLSSDYDTQTYTGGMKYFEQALSGGVLKDADAVSLHAYSNMSPEKLKKAELVERYKSKAREYNAPEDLEFWNTEVGYTTADATVVTEKNKGILNEHTNIHFKSRNLFTINSFYNFEKKGTILTDREDQFGMVSGGAAGCERYGGKCWIPTKSYLALAAMNYLMADCEPSGIYDPGDENLYISRFKSEKFGRDLLAFYTVDKPETVTMRLGTDKVTMYDYLGNSTELYGEDGVFKFNVDDRPIYLLGDISDVELTESGALTDCDKFEISTAQNDTAKIDIVNCSDREYVISAEAPLCAEITEVKNFEDGCGCVEFKNSAPLDESYYITVSIKDGGGRTVQKFDVAVRSAVAVKPSMKLELISPSNINAWKAQVEVENLSNSRPIRGTLSFKSPSSFSNMGKIKLGVIPRNTTGGITLYLPDITRKGRNTVEYEIELDNGEKYAYTQSVDTTVAVYAESKPEIDGVIKSGEWNMNAAMYADSADQVRKIYDWRGAEDLSGRSVIMWDEENFYMCAEVNDDVFFQNETGGGMWRGDSMQIGVMYGEEGEAVIGQTGTTFNEICIGLLPTGAEAFRTLSVDNEIPSGTCKDAEVCITKQNGRVDYEVKIPWKTLIGEGKNPKEGDRLGYSFLINDNDGGGRRGWIECGGGIGETKNISLFMDLLLVR